jgi:hypothetical protein
LTLLLLWGAIKGTNIRKPDLSPIKITLDLFENIEILYKDENNVSIYVNLSYLLIYLVNYIFKNYPDINEPRLESRSWRFWKKIQWKRTFKNRT